VVDCVQADSDGKEWAVTLDGPAPAFRQDDAVNNIGWHPDAILMNNSITMDSCRGFLITTSGKVVVEGNTFNHCAMPGILSEDDARGWYESTCVRDMVIRSNTFIGCGIKIDPQTVSNDPKEPVHENIRILDNTFDGGGIWARGVKRLVIRGNKPTSKVPVHVSPSCSEVENDQG